MPAAQSARLPGPGNADACRVPGLEGLAVPGGCGLCDTRWFASHVLQSPKAYTAVCRVLQEPRGERLPRCRRGGVCWDVLPGGGRGRVVPWTPTAGAHRMQGLLPHAAACALHEHSFSTNRALVLLRLGIYSSGTRGRPLAPLLPGWGCREVTCCKPTLLEGSGARRRTAGLPPALGHTEPSVSRGLTCSDVPKRPLWAICRVTCLGPLQ